MLSMDDIKYIKRLYEKEDVSIREIMRRTGYHYETIKKYLELEDFNEPLYPPLIRPSLLEPLKPIIDEWLTADLTAPRKQRHTAKRIFERLQEEYPEQLEVKLRTVQAYVSEKKKELFHAQENKAKLPLYHPPGEAQVDFGHFSYFNNAGEMIDALKLTVSFPYSNKAYCQIFGGENQQCLLQGMKNIFEYIGKIPYRMVFDNLSTAVAHVGKGHERTLTEGFKRFCEHYKFEAAFCNSAAGWEKGNVENKVGYERRNMFVPIPTILDFSEFNRELLKRCDKDGNREHYVKELSINDLFQEELVEMLPLNSIPYEVFILETRITDNWAKCSFDGNRYSTSPQYNKQTIYLKVTSDTVIVMNEKYDVIVEHPRLYGKGRESMKWLPYLNLMSRKPMAMKYTSFYEELPDNWQKFLRNQDTDGKRKGLAALHTMLLKHDLHTASAALTYALDNGVHDADSILSAYRTITSPMQQLQPMQVQQLHKDIQDVPSFPVNNHKYDDLFTKGGVAHAG
ncbi:IS21 family transposase [Chakrabartyella piscis]|uniref:IS21 family transposase n=1 Tax=Chakrabartyella piscis TaxID=2918914 RepID=UPI002958CB63|nr:IS21 family transposase [Chakrabartyella piscis]